MNVYKESSRINNREILLSPQSVIKFSDKPVDEQTILFANKPTKKYSSIYGE